MFSHESLSHSFKHSQIYSENKLLLTQKEKHVRPSNFSLKKGEQNGYIFFLWRNLIFWLQHGIASNLKCQVVAVHVQSDKLPSCSCMTWNIHCTSDVHWLFHKMASSLVEISEIISFKNFFFVQHQYSVYNTFRMVSDKKQQQQQTNNKTKPKNLNQTKQKNLSKTPQKGRILGCPLKWAKKRKKNRTKE